MQEIGGKCKRRGNSWDTGSDTPIVANLVVILVIIGYEILFGL